MVCSSQTLACTSPMWARPGRGRAGPDFICAGRMNRPGIKVLQSKTLGRAQRRGPGQGNRRQSRTTPASRQAWMVCSSQTLACTSPMWALPSRRMHRRDWPMPPPMVRAACPPAAACGRELPPCLAPGEGELTVQGGGVHPDAHGGQLKSPLQHWVPHQDIPVEGPVVVVGGPAVVWAARFERAADAHQEGDGMLFHPGILPLLGERSGQSSSSSWVVTKETSVPSGGRAVSWGKTERRVCWVSAMAETMVRTVCRR